MYVYIKDIQDTLKRACVFVDLKVYRHSVIAFCAIYRKTPTLMLPRSIIEIEEISNGFEANSIIICVYVCLVWW